MAINDPIVCVCMGIHESEIKKAIENGARTFSEVKGRTKAGMGGCQGKICRAKIEALIKKYTVLR